MKYIAEFRRPGSFGYMIAIAPSLDELFEIIEKRGWRKNILDIRDAAEWDTTATEGDRYLGKFGNLTITKGERRMTEYTSL